MSTAPGTVLALSGRTVECLWSGGLVVPVPGGSLLTRGRPGPYALLPICPLGVFFGHCKRNTPAAEESCSSAIASSANGTLPPFQLPGAKSSGLISTPSFPCHVFRPLRRTSRLYLQQRSGRQLLLPTPTAALSSSLPNYLSFHPFSRREHSNAAARAALEHRSGPVAAAP